MTSSTTDDEDSTHLYETFELLVTEHCGKVVFDIHRDGCWDVYGRHGKLWGQMWNYSLANKEVHGWFMVCATIRKP